MSAPTTGRAWWNRDGKRVAVVALGTSLKRVRILVPRLGKPGPQSEIRSVKPASLTPRDVRHEIDAIAEARES